MEPRPLLDLLAGRAFPELAAALRMGRDAIVRQWEGICREVIPKADQLSEPQLRDDAPKVLDHVADALESDRARHTDDLVDVTAEHGLVRYQQNFDIGELLIEYNLLRAVVLDHVRQHLRRPPELAEQIALNAALDVMCRRSVRAFADYQSRELQAATEAHSKYLSFLSHDLRGGLNGVFLMIEVLKRELAGESKFAATVQDLDAMRRSLMETVGTMDRFLNAERFRKGKVQLKPGRIILKPLLEEVTANFNYQARDKGVELTVEAPADCVFSSDRELLTIILQNLVSNAVKYTERGRVTVTAGPTSDGGCQVSVSDQGPGIPPERLSDLFTAFTRGDTHGKPGVGLGLSIARQAAEYLGAKLWAESKPGKGSTFHVRLPPESPAK
jgi:signal transduction histidine kinase